MSKRRYDSEQAKKDIIESSIRLFSQRGYNQTSISDISKDSGYSKGHIYYHFESKEKLFVLLAQRTMKDWYDKWAEKEEMYGSVEEKLYGIAQYVLYNYQTPLLRAGQELAASPDVSEESRQKLYGLAVTPMNTYRAILQQGIEQGEFKQGNIEEWTVLLGTWLGGLCQLTEGQELSNLEPLFKQAITIFLSAIRIQPAP